MNAKINPGGFLSRVLLSAVGVATTLSPAFTTAEDLTSLRQPWLNAELIAWDQEILQHHRLAQALGYDQVADYRNTRAPGESQAHPQHSAGMGFYINDPHKKVQPSLGFTLSDRELKQAVKKYPHTFSWYPSLSRAIDEREIAAMRQNDPELFEKVKAAFERSKSWSHPNREFPNNLAQLQVWGDGNRWEPATDFQRQELIDEMATAIADYAKSAERDDIDFKFTGIVIDVIEIWEEFSWQSTRPLRGTPETNRTAAPRPGVTYDYATYREGWFVFLGQLRDELEAAFPGRPIRFIWEPTPIVGSWIEPFAEADYPTLTPELRDKIRGDALIEEKPGMEYLVDPRVQESGHWAPHLLGTASGDLLTKNPHYPTQLAYLGEISSRGSYLLSYGTFDRSWRPIEGYENQFKLIRALSAWQNMHETPVDTRTWDASQSIYQSPTAYADPHVLAGLHSKNDHVYAVLLDAEAAIHFADGVQVQGLRSANAYWEPQTASPQARVVDGVLTPTANAAFPVSVVAEITRSQDAVPPNVFATAPGIVHTQDKSTFTLPNSELLNPSFENGSEGWAGTGNAQLRFVENPVADGNIAAHVTNRQQPWHGLYQDVTGVLMNTMQGRYRVTAKIRPAKTDSQFVFGLAFLERGERSEYWSDSTPAPAGEWTTVSQVFDLNWGDWIENGRLVFRRPGKNLENFFVDDVTLEYLGR